MPELLPVVIVTLPCVVVVVAVNMTTEPSPLTTTPGGSKFPSVSFDAASFLGGIILGAAVVAICLVAWKCYQHRRQREVPYSAMAQ